MFSCRWWPLLTILFASPVFGQAPTPEDTTFFEQKVRPLLIEKCYSCHSEQAKKQKGGLFLDSREAILKGGDSGAAVVVGDAEKSLLMRAVRYKEADLQMPPKSKLSDREIATLEQWVKRGVVFPSSGSTVKVAKKIDFDAGKKFWSFQPVREQPLPKINATTWPKQRIDTFLLAEMEQRQLKPSAPASKAVLLRRAKFDLLGLPPTPEEITAFEKDASPEAFAKQVNAWLDSPHYGERWARLWLDLARYCDIGEEWTTTKGQPYHYRDWVVRALNTDMPYTQFVRLQLAADLLSDAKPEDLAALGFIGLSPTYWKELQLPVEIIKTIVSDEYEERIHTLTSTFLGLNAACARCHDHKFDPISNEDYYALAGVFASTKQADQALARGVMGDKVTETKAQIAKLEAELKKLQAKKTENPPKMADKMAEMEKELTTLKALPGLDATLIPGVRDASLQVIAAKGTHGSQVIYKDGAQDLAIEIRGNPNNTGAVVPKRFLQVLSKEVTPFKNGSGRSELANAMLTDAQGLLARVFVNRVWKQHFGIGLVETPSDFGTQGERPSHPALLDDLAARFIANGWSLKWLHKEIMLSATYQQVSGIPPATDASNRYLSCFPRKRLDVEAWRDALFFVAGNLNLNVGGAPIELTKADNNRRTLYGLVRRRELTDILRLHDFPDPVTHSPNRVPTTTPLQQLFTLNSPLVASQSAVLVKRLQTDVGADAEKRIERAYWLLYGRAPTPKQRDLGKAFVASNTDAAWQQYAQVLLGSNEFLFVD